MDNIAKLASELIKFKSIKENISERKRIVSFVKTQFKNVPVFIKEFDKNNNPSIIITLKKEKCPKIFLIGHLDVVLANDSQFQSKIKDKKLFGRGAGDMKLADAVMIEVVKYFAKKKRKLSLGLMLTTDEETGGFNGVNFLLNNKKYSSKLAIIPDGGPNLKNIIVNQKGVLHLKLKSFGISAHASRPFLGQNAIDDLYLKYLKIRKIIPFTEKNEWKDTMSLGKFYGGEAINKVPDYAEMFIDIRYIKDNGKKIILKKISNIVNWELISHGKSLVQSTKNIYLKEFKKLLKSETGDEVFFSKVEGSSDARFFSENKIPVIITRINCGNIHGENEWGDLEEANIFQDVLKKFINKICDH
ncbi:MAG TPA: M20/M25/M40 family metallo-hydrolase [Candidatus Moranbacteria bacterium]|nr:M20/M25/M40 family metallo-hydrolase [Candidatus Moranbacteria bacterium]